LASPFSRDVGGAADSSRFGIILSLSAVHQWAQDTLFLGPLPPQNGRNPGITPRLVWSRSTAPARAIPISPSALGGDIRCWGSSLYRGRAAKSTTRTGAQRHPGDTLAASSSEQHSQGAGDGRDRGARKTRIHRRDGQTSHASRRDRGSSGECVGWRTRIGRERGVGDLPGRRTRRARMSSGPGGIARQLIDLPVEDQRYQSAKQTEGQDQAGPRPDRRSFTLACPRRLPHHL